MNKTKVLIIGSAPAGYTAALYAARANLEPIVITGSNPGGQLMLTSVIENFPGFPDGIEGPELMMNMKKQAENFGATMVAKQVESIDFSKRPFKVTAGKEEYEAETIIVASGASVIWLGVKGEAELTGKGVSSCATCDAAFYRDKTVAVVGGGDSAMEDTLALTKCAKKIYLIHRRDELRASKIMQERVLKNEKVHPMWNSEVVEVMGDPMVNKIKIKNTKNGVVADLDVNGLFIAIGHKPTTDFLDEKINTDDKGYIIPVGETGTNIEGVFVAGDVADSRYRQAITAAGQGCKAAIDAEKYLEDR